MSIFSKLFGGGKSGGGKDAEPVEHNGYRIFAEPAKEDGGYRIASRIEKDFGEETKTHHLIRADVCSSLDEATELSVNKSKQVIYQQGETIFD